MKEVRKLSEEEIEKARSLYLAHKGAKEVAEIIGVPRETIQYYVNKYWKKERQLESQNILCDISTTKRDQLLEISGMSLSIIKNSLTDLAKRDRPLTAFEARTVAALFGELDKILKLDQGSPTDIIASTKPATIIELKERLGLDPFFNDIKHIGGPDEETDSNVINVRKCIDPAPNELDSSSEEPNPEKDKVNPTK